MKKKIYRERGSVIVYRGSDKSTPTKRTNMNTIVSIDNAVKTITANLNGTTACTVHLHSPMDSKMNKFSRPPVTPEGEEPKPFEKVANPYLGKGVIKVETLNGIIGYNYGAAVNRLAAKEGNEDTDRVVKPHAWGDLDDSRAIRTHRKNGEKYLSMKVQGKPKVIGYFFPDGTPIAASSIAPFLPPKGKKSSTQEGLEGEVVALDYAFRNIQWVRLFGNVMTMEHASPVEYKAVEEVEEEEAVEA